MHVASDLGHRPFGKTHLLSSAAKAKRGDGCEDIRQAEFMKPPASRSRTVPALFIIQDATPTAR